MDLKSIIKKIFISTCVIFTAVTVFYCILVALMNSDDERILFEATRIVLFFFFALIVSLANAVFTMKQIPTALRYIIHYLLCAFAFYLCVLFPIESIAAPSFVLIGLSLFTVIYVLACAVISIVKSKLQRKKEKQETYTAKFSK